MPTLSRRGIRKNKISYKSMSV
uniref:Uncharacterized protein n=1 Tax=Anguilla anguilla TaxID=7936 RepID=A0A0E9X9Z3_ANGAN